ncbi:response regulator [Cohnella soli]|uniref:Response regulator transcription factor n=1 Tax=Cohnella soli TaxID=425005 RepID=A0ABW0HV00_9BACL
MIRVLIADDQSLLRDGLQTIINLEDDMSTAGLASDGQEAVEFAASLHPDVVLMDIRMPRLNGIESLQAIKQTSPGILVLILTTFMEHRSLIEAVAAGADGYLLKDIGGEEIVRAIRLTIQGHPMLPSLIAAGVHMSEGTFRVGAGAIYGKIDDNDRAYAVGLLRENVIP